MAEAEGGGLCPTGAARGVWLGASVLTPPCIGWFSLGDKFSSELVSIGKTLPEEGRTSLECAGLLEGRDHWMGR